MTDEIALNRATERAAHAAALQRNEMLTEAFDTLKASYTSAWLATGPMDTPAREKLWQAVQIVGKVKDHLQKVVSDGKLAQAELNILADRRSLADRARQAVFG